MSLKIPFLSKSTVPTRAIRGPALTFRGDPFVDGVEAAMVYEPDAIVAFGEGRITHFGPAGQVKEQLPSRLPIRLYGAHSLIMPGFVDAHVHYPQTPMIGAHGAQLLEWLTTYTFPTERRFADKAFADGVARVFLDECLRNGVTTSCVYATVHPHSVDALFEEAERRKMRIAAGKVMMDRNAPADLLDTAQSSYDDSKALIEKWRGRGRLTYAITPRFAITSSEAQLEAAGALARENPDCLIQTHISENAREVEEVLRLFPERKNYLDVYDHYGLCRAGAVFGHGIHLGEDELARMSACGCAVAHCPTSNFFLGSGAFHLGRAKRKGRPVRVGLGTDIGAGTSFSMFATLNEAYKASQAHGDALLAAHGFYLATRGGAQAMGLEDKVGSLGAGMEADIVVLDMKSTPLIAYRMGFANDIHEALFIQMTMADDRAVKTTYVAGEQRYARPAREDGW